MKIAIYPGIFDPITNGHIDVIERSSLLFDRVIVAVLGTSNNKQLVFSEKERLELVNKSVSSFKNVEVERVRAFRIKYYVDLVTKKPDLEKFYFGWFKRSLEV